MISKMHEDLLIHVEDNDGYFLLIEAANHLPSWLNPESAENRVFIYQNNVHIIPPDVSDLEKQLSISDAIQFIFRNPETTKADILIQDSIWNRVKEYPEKIHNNLHKAIVRVPVDLAAILTLKPYLISPIVNAYCNHDILEEKLFRNVPFNDCVQVQIIFTKYLYAMLLNSKPVKSFKLFKSIDTNDKKNQLGLKLTCGFKIIENQSTKDIFSSSEYLKFLSSLTKNGYFKDNIEGSKDYMQLLEKAKSYFSNIECPINTQVCHEISDLKLLDVFVDTKNKVISNSNLDMSEDDDDWLDVSPEQINNILNTRYGESDNMDESKLKPSNQITSTLADFLKTTSDFEGIERPVEDLDDENDKIEFDTEEFADCINRFLNIVTSDTKVDSDFSDDFSDEDISQDIDDEVLSRLKTNLKSDNDSIVENFVDSMKEEGITGPTSNVLKTIGINKMDLLDSDDDE
ncbi:protein ecdysoneless homolog isoform X2 [Leptidea sinapis]|uniref:protein ecdysoneless homolog isoform X2 n=1 Tax=Leptidea sinapis TaxID=189913 RepID=UPI0021C3700A|nr:protein ecdysoneless homolog isoform X2 [Leptidea sinapis]